MLSYWVSLIVKIKVILSMYVSPEKFVTSMTMIWTTFYLHYTRKLSHDFFVISKQVILWTPHPIFQITPHPLDEAWPLMWANLNFCFHKKYIVQCLIGGGPVILEKKPKCKYLETLIDDCEFTWTILIFWNISFWIFEECLSINV